jgi:stearoyl-CoA desaturase (Delta-9 desaturase)
MGTIGESQARTNGRIDDILYPDAVSFAAVHIAAIAAVWTGVTSNAVALCLLLYALRMFGVCAGYHRYFAHRAFATSRPFQFILAFLAQSSAQKSVLWWAAQHRHHHRHSDTAHDAHSPRHNGFWHAHIGWIFTSRNDQIDLSTVSDLTRYPELMWLHRFERGPAAALAGLVFVFAGWSGLVVGFLWSTILLYHATFLVNSLAHMHGRKRYVTGDESRNNWMLAIVTMGEGWHNNHHAYPSSVRQGFQWWEVDVTYYALDVLRRIGLVWHFTVAPRSVINNEQRLGTRIIDRAASELASTFDARRIAADLAHALPAGVTADVDLPIAAVERRAADRSTDVVTPALPTRCELQKRAELMFVSTPSLNDIIERANRKLFDAVQRQLSSERGRHVPGAMGLLRKPTDDIQYPPRLAQH